MGDTYRETALEQAVLSHGTIEVAMSMPHSNYRAPNDPAQVVKAATVYEQFLTRNDRTQELQEHVVKLARQLRNCLALDEDTDHATARLVLDEYDQWKTTNTPEEPF